MNRRFFAIVLITTVLFSACSTATVAGIDKPVEVRGVELQLTEVSLEESVTRGGRISKPSPPYDIIVVVKATTTSEDFKKVCGWGGDDQVNLSWVYKGTPNNGDWSICGSISIGSEEETTIEFYFASNEGAEDFVLNFPGDTKIPLDSLID